MNQNDLDEKLLVTEIFHSIQGESTLVGERTTFVRLTGCPLRCSYCDTTYSYSGGNSRTISSIINEVLSHNTKWVCLTGGEPLVQKKSILLVNTLNGLGKKISIETDGEEDVSAYVGKAKIILDVKTPGSGEVAERCFLNFGLLDSSDEIKFVLCDEIDYAWAKKVCDDYKLVDRFTVLFSPVYGKLALHDLAKWIVQDQLGVRLQTQLHKHIWGENQKGV